jgi:DNA polymerase elongation subunit (family B)
LEPLVDEHLLGWNPTPGIVSVWAQRDGRALVWQRLNDHVRCTSRHFRPWLYAASLADLAYLGRSLAAETAPNAESAPVTYRELEGPANAYHYLISARPGYALERAVLNGATQRLGRTIHSLYDLDDSYYWVGPVEQYLMATGEVYFRGLAHADLHRLQFDLETTALDPERGRIFLIAVRDSRGLELTLEAPAPADEPRLIAELCALIRERDPDVIENHNLFGFDLPFLTTRAAKLGVPLRLSRREGPARLEQYADPYQRHRSKHRRMRFSVAGRELIDTLDAVRRYDFAARDLPSYRLKDVARHFGVATAERVYLAGAAVFETYQTTPELTRRYALDDVAEVDAISQRLLGAAFALAGMAPRRFERLASAGPAMGILEPLLVRAYFHAGAALPCPSAEERGVGELHEGGGVHLFATGIAEHVVKADVASLYPSLMRTYRIGPECDRLGVLLHLVSRLTDLRLEHKQAARLAAPGSLAFGLHDANQAAMKILINSAYGYLGAGSMALFADRRAAGEVTRRGREILDQVVAGLRTRGMALLEADTDGVYFAVPADWTEAQERSLVSEIGALLPDGIRLEYEGRYRAMFSYEVKNYALLTYSGTLILRGVALRSSRSEPFGERFLQQAMRCALLGDSAGVHAAFRDTVAALRSRALTAGDVAARVRLTKTPETYRASRATQREQQYEALLNAGRGDWTPGERVRVYRAEGGAAVWIPDETEDSHPGSSADQPDPPVERRDYDVAHYIHVLLTSYAARLRKAFAPEDFEQLFRLDDQLSIFDQPIEQIEPRWIRCR